MSQHVQRFLPGRAAREANDRREGDDTRRSRHIHAPPTCCGAVTSRERSRYLHSAIHYGVGFVGGTVICLARETIESARASASPTTPVGLLLGLIGRPVGGFCAASFAIGFVAFAPLRSRRRRPRRP